jgi:hypothetical protein
VTGACVVADEKILPDDTAFDVVEHKRFDKLTPTEPTVGGPIVKPAMVTVTPVDAPIAAPVVVITNAVADVVPHVAVNPATLLAPDATVGTTDDAKKFVGYERVKALPDNKSDNGEKTIVTGTDILPDIRSEEAILNEASDKLRQNL